jgi:hypothetical protein
MMNVTLFVNNVQLDIDEKFPLPVTFSQADAKNPESRKRSTSKTCELPGTVINNTFFASTYDVRITDVYNDLIGFNYDPTLRYPVVVRENGSVIFIGACNLLKCIRKKKVNRFMIAMFSEIVDIFQSLGDLKVSELDWSAYNHTLSVANLQASMSAATGSGYVYGLVHYGLTTNLLNYKTNQLWPHIYIKEFIEKCFALSQKTVTSSFFNTTRMKKLVWGYGGGEPILIDSTEIANRQAHYTGDGIASYVFHHSLYIPVTQITQWNYTKYIQFSDNTFVTMTQVTDTYSQYDENTGEIIVFNSGSFNLNISGTFPVSYALTDLTFITNYHISLNIQIFKNGALISNNVVDILDTNDGTQNAVFAINQTLDCSSGDIVYAILKVQTFVSTHDNAVGEDLLLDVDLNNTLVINFTALNLGLIDGDTVEIARTIPEMKAADLLKDIMIAFNMYMSDPDQNGAVVFEPMNNGYFFGTDDTDNWTDKLAIDQDIEIEPASNIDGKVYRFRFAEDRDYWKQKYYNLYGHDYGDYDYNVPSTFKKGEKLYQLKIAQTCPVRIPGTDIIIPMIVKRDPTTSVDQPHKGKPRMYFYNGLKSCDNWTLENSDTGALTTMTSYPQFHHLDDLITATFDLNFGVPVGVFYPGTTYTNKNLFMDCHAQPIRELTGRDSKIVNAWFHLRADDLYYNFMRKLVNVSGTIYRKNLVKDYLAGSNSLVQVELIRVVAANSRRNYTVPMPQIFESAVGNTTTVTTNEYARSDKKSYVVDTSGGDVTMTYDSTLFDYSEGQSWDFVKVGTGNLILTVASGETISGSTTQTIRTNYDAPEVIYKQGEFYFK